MANRIPTLIKQLLLKSNQGKIKWEKTIDTGVFQAAFPGYSVRIYSEPSREYDEGEDFFLQLRNDQGETVEVISDGDFYQMMPNETPSAFAMMKELYEIARRTAMGIEAAVDTILSQLEDDDDTP